MDSKLILKTTGFARGREGWSKFSEKSNCPREWSLACTIFHVLSKYVAHIIPFRYRVRVCRRGPHGVHQVFCQLACFCLRYCAVRRCKRLLSSPGKGELLWTFVFLIYNGRDRASVVASAVENIRYLQPKVIWHNIVLFRLFMEVHLYTAGSFV